MAQSGLNAQHGQTSLEHLVVCVVIQVTVAGVRLVGASCFGGDWSDFTAVFQSVGVGGVFY